MIKLVNEFSANKSRKSPGHICFRKVMFTASFRSAIPALLRMKSFYTPINPSADAIIKIKPNYKKPRFNGCRRSWVAGEGRLENHVFVFWRTV